MNKIYDGVRPTIGWFSGQDGRCRVRVWQDDRAKEHVVLISAIKGAGGISITNSIERVAGSIIRDLELIHEDVTVIEYWPAESRGDPDCGEGFSRVSFALPPSGDRGTSCACEWKHVTREYVEELVGEPIPRGGEEP